MCDFSIFLFPICDFVIFCSKMRIKIAFEIGHSSSKKNKTSPEGFTHDWELFVRGSDGNNVSRFVDKVVFNLHESFQKPIRGKCPLTSLHIFRFPSTTSIP